MNSLPLPQSKKCFFHKQIFFLKVKSSLKPISWLFKQQLLLYICMSFLFLFPTPPRPPGSKVTGTGTYGSKYRGLSIYLTSYIKYDHECCSDAAHAELIALYDFVPNSSYLIQRSRSPRRSCTTWSGSLSRGCSTPPKGLPSSTTEISLSSCKGTILRSARS